MKFGITAAAIACLMVSNVLAQQTQSDSERAGSDRATRSTQTQDLSSERPGTAQSDVSQSRSGQFAGTQSSASSGSEQVKNYLVACMLGKNKAEIELAQLAQQQAESPEVKEFAQQMVQDHQKIVQQLQGLAGSSQSGFNEAASSNTQSGAQRQASDSTRLPGSPGAGQQGSAASSATSSRSLAGTSGQSSEAIMQLMRIEQAVIEQCAQSLSQELQQKQGAEFDKAYVGSQIAGHMQMLAALKVIGQQGPQQLQQVAQQAQPTVQQHLDHAKQLMQQLEGTGTGSSQAERPSSRTQR